MPSTRRGFAVFVLGADALLFEVGAHGDDFDVVDVPEVVAEVQFAEVEGHAEFGELRAVGGTEESYGDIGAGGLSVLKGRRWGISGLTDRKSSLEPTLKDGKAIGWKGLRRAHGEELGQDQ